MPIFEYRCDKCGQEFEELVFGSTKVACPKCQGAKVTKQLSVPARATASSARAAGPACDAGMPMGGGGCCGGGGCHQH